MEIQETKIKDLLILKPRVFEDSRGYFFESFNLSKFKEKGLNYNFIQDNQAKSSYGVIRGLHLQTGDYAQAKLIRVLSGKILDVVVDVRKNSATYGKSYGIELSEENKLQFMIPRGFAHGYSVLSEKAVVLYKCDNIYMPSHESGIIYNDNTLNIDWKIPRDKEIISDKDKKLQSFRKFSELIK